MPPMPPRLTKEYLRKRLWLAKIAIGGSLLISVIIGWQTLSAFETHGAYARVLTDLMQSIQKFETEMAWSAARGDGPNKLPRTTFRDIAEIYAFIRAHDGDKHEPDSQISFIEGGLPISPDSLKARYGLGSGAMPESIREIWHPDDDVSKGLEAAVGRFLMLGYRLLQMPEIGSPEYQVTISALRTTMRNELSPTFHSVLNSLAGRTSSSARTGLYLLMLCAVAGLVASGINGLFIFRPMLYSMMATQDALMLERDRALASERAKREFLSMMSHELRTPLNGILGFTNLLMTTTLAPKQKDYAETIQSAGMTLLDLVNDIIDITHIETGNIGLEKTDFSLEDIASEVLKLTGPQAFAKRLDLGAYVDTALPEKLAGDAARLRQVLLKLVGNAIKFTEHGGVAIEIKQTGTTPDGDLDVVFTVSDTGIGVPKSRFAEIFEQFTQIDASSSRKHGGAGLGLPICKRLVNLMSGEMGVESTLGKGSSFWFRLPLSNVIPPASKIIDSMHVNLEGKRILVVDDNALNRHIFRLQLEGFKAEVECHSDGRAALEALAEAMSLGRPFDVAIIDHMMPDIDGITLRKMIRETPVYDNLRLIISSSGGIAFDQQARALGFDAACPKPVVQEKLIHHIQTLLNQPLRQRPSDPNGGQTPSLSIVDEPLRRARLLVAEDNPINQRLIVTALNEAGFVVDAVADGVEAVHAMQRLPYDLILMDIRMPVMSGVDATRRIRSMPVPAGKVPIIAMTANTLPGDREEYLAAGMNEYVPKPINFPDLLEKIQAYLDGTAPEQPQPGPDTRRRPSAQKRPA